MGAERRSDCVCVAEWARGRVDHRVGDEVHEHPGQGVHVDRDGELTGCVDVIHTAGVIHPGRVSEFFATNTRGTEAMLGRLKDPATVARIKREMLKPGTSAPDRIASSVRSTRFATQNGR